MERRGFLGAMLAAGMAPAIVRADSLMKIIIPKQQSILTPDLICKEMIAQFEQGISALRGMGVGDVFTISGMKGIFVVTSEKTSFPPLPDLDSHFRNISHVGRVKSW